MKRIKQYIREEIQRLMEKDYEAPDEILGALQNQLEMVPLERYITHLKSVNSIPPSYEIFLHNGESFLIIYETFSLLAKIGSKEYFLNDIDERNYCKQHINRLLTGPKFPEEEEEMEDMGGAPPPPPKGGGAPPKLPPLPPLPGGPAPADEE